MLNLNYIPQKVVDTVLLTREEWEKKRNIGIGGSEGAAILGKSKFQTNLDVYYRKLGYPKEEVDDVQQFLFDAGHAMEPMVARAFSINHPDWRVETDTIMYRHPLFPYMIADVDFVAYKPDGTKVIVECKFVTHESEDAWREAPPEYYKIQCRHYMSVLNLNEAYLCALWGNNPKNDYVEWPVTRDLLFEEDYIHQLGIFWENVQSKTEPPLAGGYAKSVLESVKRFHPTDKKESLDLSNCSNEEFDALADALDGYRKAKTKSALLKKKLEAAENDMKVAQAKVVAALDGHESGYLTTSDGVFYVSNKPTNRKKVNLQKLQADYPDLYEKLVKISVTATDLKAANAAAYKSCTEDSETDSTRFNVTFK